MGKSMYVSHFAVIYGQLSIWPIMSQVQSVLLENRQNFKKDCSPGPWFSLHVLVYM